jgi:hypothetical protein
MVEKINKLLIRRNIVCPSLWKREILYYKHNKYKIMLSLFSIILTALNLDTSDLQYTSDLHLFTLLIFDVQQTHKIKVQGHILCIELLWHFPSWHFYLKSDIWVICLFQIFTARLLWSYLSWRISGTRGKFDISELCIFDFHVVGIPQVYKWVKSVALWSQNKYKTIRATVPPFTQFLSE